MLVPLSEKLYFTWSFVDAPQSTAQDVKAVVFMSSVVELSKTWKNNPLDVLLRS